MVSHTYNSFNQLVSTAAGTTTITYAYNAQGIRTSRTVGLITTHYLLDGGNVVGEVTGDTTTAYIRGANLIYGNGSYYLYNAHGDVVQLTNINGELTRNYNYDAFGNEKAPDEEDTNPFRYCGEYYDTETGLYYLRARYYSPGIGRFISEDPIRDGNNWYTYVYGNPVLYKDPSGLSGIMSDGTYCITHPLDEQLLRLKEEYETANAERRAEIAREAQAIRDSGVRDVDWSVLATKPLSYYYIDTDVTERLHQVMIDSADKYGYMREYDSVVDVAVRYATFYQLVKPGGIYDLKSHSEWQGRAHFIYSGEIIWFDDPGNMLYGYLGSAMGFSPLILRLAGGIVQITEGNSSFDFYMSFFDDPRDQKAIVRGIQMYRNNSIQPIKPTFERTVLL